MIILKSPQEIEKIRVSGHLIAEALRHITDMVRPGITTLDLSDAAENILLSRGAKLAFKGYKREMNGHPFPACLCTSINEEVVHGIPSAKIKLKKEISSVWISVLQ